MSGVLKWFPFYIDDWDTDERVRGLSYLEQGVYLAMLRWQWREGSLPSRPGDVARTLRAPHRVVTVLLRRFFEAEGDGTGRVVNRRMVDLRAQQVLRLEKDADKARRYREREQGRHGDDTVASRSRSRIRVEIKKSLESADSQKPKGTT